MIEIVDCIKVFFFDLLGKELRPFFFIGGAICLSISAMIGIAKHLKKKD